MVGRLTDAGQLLKAAFPITTKLTLHRCLASLLLIFLIGGQLAASSHFEHDQNSGAECSLCLALDRDEEVLLPCSVAFAERRVYSHPIELPSNDSATPRKALYHSRAPPAVS